jgi:hypothetical protein
VDCSGGISVELAAQVIREVEAHKTAAAFMLSAAVRGCTLPAWAGGQRG